MERNECRCDGCVEQEMFEELAETRRQRDLLLDAARHVQNLDKLGKANVPRWADEWADAHVAMYDAIRECEPPKPTREELEREVVKRAVEYARWREDTHVPGSSGLALLNAMCEAAGILAALDALDECEPPKPPEPSQEERVLYVLMENDIQWPVEALRGLAHRICRDALDGGGQ